MSINKKIEALNQKRKEVMLGGGEKAIEKQKESGKLTARERIELLVDKGSFNEYDLFVQHSAREFGMADKVLNGDRLLLELEQLTATYLCVCSRFYRCWWFFGLYACNENCENSRFSTKNESALYWNK